MNRKRKEKKLDGLNWVDSKLILISVVIQEAEVVDGIQICLICRRESASPSLLDCHCCSKHCLDFSMEQGLNLRQHITIDVGTLL